MIAGAGSIGRRHLRNLLALGERDILLYRSHRSTLPEEELSAFPVETDLGVALAQHPQAVIVSNPTSLHLEVAIPAVEVGCHLLLEKPISHSMDRVAELEAASRRSGARILVGYQFRFHPGLKYIKELLSKEAIGRPLSVRAHWGEYLPGWHPWEDYRQGYSARTDLGGGVILTLSHPLDYLLWLLGTVDSLWAFVGKLGDLDLDIEDTAEIGLSFASGVLGSVHLDYNQQPASHHLEIVGTQGTLRWDNDDGTVRVFREGNQEWELAPPTAGFERNDLFLSQMRHFLSIARGEAQPVCNLGDGVMALQLALQALESAKHGRPVKVEPRDRKDGIIQFRGDELD
jgi:predicted dehydrogenase